MSADTPIESTPQSELPKSLRAGNIGCFKGKRLPAGGQSAQGSLRCDRHQRLGKL